MKWNCHSRNWHPKWYTEFNLNYTKLCNQLNYFEFYPGVCLPTLFTAYEQVKCVRRIPMFSTFVKSNCIVCVQSTHTSNSVMFISSSNKFYWSKVKTRWLGRGFWLLAALIAVYWEWTFRVRFVWIIALKSHEAVNQRHRTLHTMIIYEIWHSKLICAPSTQNNFALQAPIDAHTHTHTQSNRKQQTSTFPINLLTLTVNTNCHANSLARNQKFTVLFRGIKELTHYITHICNRIAISR